MSQEFCSKCGKYISANESTIRLGVDNEIEIVCSDCVAIEQRSTANSPVDMSDTKLESSEIIEQRACESFLTRL